MSFFRNPICMVLLGSVLLCGCAGKETKRGAAQKAGARNDSTEGGAKRGPIWQTRLGRVVLVNRSLDFVLIDAGTSPSPEPGTRLRAYADGAPSAELAVSVHQQRPYLIADILSGEPHVSDMVVPLRGSSSPGEEKLSPRSEREPNSASTGLETRRKSLPAAGGEDLPPDKSVVGSLQTPDLPQIERRPPPAPQSLLTPGRILREESDSIIPGLPLPGKSPGR